jgi:hypothetical protein
MKILAFLLLLIFSTSSYSQNINFGIEVSPSFELQSIRNKSTGLFSSISGYGFNIGMPIKFNLDNERSISSGITYEFTAFDNKINNYLVSSLRLNSLHVPFIYNIPVIEGFYFNTGVGLNYIFSSKQFGGGIWLNTNSIVNQVQPYIAAGLSTLVDLGSNNYELGVNARYHIIDIWQYANQTRTKIIGIDLNMKYYF